jgi:hypothetical protein
MAKHITKFLLLLFALIISQAFLACDGNSHTSVAPNEPIIIGRCPEPPELSKDSLLFTAQGGIDSIIVAGLFDSFAPDFGGGGCRIIGAENDSDYCKNNYCNENPKGINCSNYGKWDNNNNHGYCISNNLKMKTECPWFTITRTGANTILVSVTENETGKERKELGIALTDGICHSYFTIIQSAE